MTETRLLEIHLRKTRLEKKRLLEVVVDEVGVTVMVFDIGGRAAVDVERVVVEAAVEEAAVERVVVERAVEPPADG